MAITLIATPDPSPSTRVIIRRVKAPRDRRTVSSSLRPMPLRIQSPGLPDATNRTLSASTVTACGQGFSS
jgi:hypothetical protein